MFDFDFQKCKNIGVFCMRLIDHSIYDFHASKNTPSAVIEWTDSAK